jgi:hypothetical protein
MTNMNALSELLSYELVSPELIELRLSLLIQRYLKEQTKAIAQSVVKQLEALLCHPACIGYPNHRCSYKKMLQHWKALSL